MLMYRNKLTDCINLSGVSGPWGLWSKAWDFITAVEITAYNHQSQVFFLNWDLIMNNKPNF